MQSTTINVKYVNPPKGRGPASVKDANGTYWKFWTRDIPLERFAVGGTYMIGYKNEPYNGQDQFYIVEAMDAGALRQPAAQAQHQQQIAAPPAGNSNGHSNGNGQRDEFIFVCGIINQGVAAGSINPHEVSSVTDAINAARNAYQLTFAK